MFYSTENMTYLYSNQFQLKKDRNNSLSIPQFEWHMNEYRKMPTSDYIVRSILMQNLRATNL